MSVTDLHDWMTVDELAPVMRSSPGLIYREVKAGRFPLEPVKVGRKLLFSKAQLLRLLDPETKAAAQPADRPTIDATTLASSPKIHETPRLNCGVSTAQAGEQCPPSVPPIGCS